MASTLTETWWYTIAWSLPNGARETSTYTSVFSWATEGAFTWNPVTQTLYPGPSNHPATPITTVVSVAVTPVRNVANGGATPTSGIGTSTSVSSGVAIAPLTQNTGTATGSTSSITSSGSSQSTNTTSSTTSASSTSTASPPAPVQRGLSSGAAAGIGIGCAIAGAFIATALVCIFMRKRRPKPRVIESVGRGKSMRGSRYDGDSKNPNMAMLPLTGTDSGAILDSKLPPATQDRDITGDFSRLSTVIKNHAHSYYGTSGTQLQKGDTISGRNAHQLLGSDALIDARTLSSLLANSRSRLAAVRYIIAWTIIRNIELSGPPETTLLPPELAECMQAMSSSSSDPDSRMLLLSKWRQISGTLMRSTYGSNSSISSNDPRQHNLTELANALNALLQDFSSNSNSAERQQSLDEIVRRGARLGYMLFTQPSTWSFDWTNNSSSPQDALVVYPALVQTGDGRGQRRPRAEPYSDKEIVAIRSGT